MSIVETKTEVLHYAPSANRFFDGGADYQILAKVTYLFGKRVRIKEIDREDVPHWHYVQQRTLGLSEWRSRLLKELK
jgi:hypothetical protein